MTDSRPQTTQIRVESGPPAEWDGGMDELRQILENVKPGEVRTGGQAYTDAGSKFETTAGLLRTHASTLASVWKGEDADAAQKQMQRLNATGSELGYRNKETGRALDQHAEKLEWYQQNMPGGGIFPNVSMEDGATFAVGTMIAGPAGGMIAVGGKKLGEALGLWDSEEKEAAKAHMKGLQERTAQTNDIYMPKEVTTDMPNPGGQYGTPPGYTGDPGGPGGTPGGGPNGGIPSGGAGGAGVGAPPNGGAGGAGVGAPPNGGAGGAGIGAPPNGGAGGAGIGAPPGGSGSNLAGMNPSGGNPGLGGAGDPFGRTGLGGGGGGMPPGGGGGGIPSGGAGGLAGGMPGAGMGGGAGAGRGGMGAGAGKGGMGAGRPGMGGMGAPMGGGARGGGGGGGQDENERSTWLHEDEDVWGGSDGDTSPPVIG